MMYGKYLVVIIIIVIIIKCPVRIISFLLDIYMFLKWTYFQLHIIIIKIWARFSDSLDIYYVVLFLKIATCLTGLMPILDEEVDCGNC